MANKFLIGLGVATLLGAINKNNKNNKNKNNNSRSKKKNKVELEEKYFIDQFNRVHKIKFSQKLIDVIKKGAYLVIDNAVFKLYHGPDDKLYLRSFILDKNNFKELNEGKEISIADHKFRIFVNKKNNKRIIGCAYKDAKKLRGSFSETTSASFSVDTIGLTTSFTGEDSLDVTIDSGSGAGATAFDMGDGSGGALTVDGLTYTFPVGGATIMVGDATDISPAFTGACTYSAFTDATPDDCGTDASATAAGSYAFDSGFSLAGGLSSPETGIMSEADADDSYGIDAAYTADSYGLEAAYTADSYGVSAAYADDEAFVPYWSVDGSYSYDFANLSAGIETEDTGAEAEGYFAGLSFADSATEFYAYEPSYSYPVNDGMTIKPGVFINEGTTGEDKTGVVVKSSFSF